MKRYLLFDSGCSLCTELAEQIETLSEGKLAVRSLRDPQVQVWRTEALGPDAPWAPTLLAVEGEQVRGWTGFPMAGQLLWLLGPRKSWQVLQLLQEISQPTEIIPNSSRRRFLKSLGAASFGMFVLSGKKLAFAEEPTPGKARHLDYKELNGDEAKRVAGQVLKSQNATLILNHLSYAKPGKTPTVYQVEWRERGESYSRYVGIIELASNDPQKMPFMYFSVVNDDIDVFASVIDLESDKIFKVRVEENRSVQSTALSCSYSCMFNCLTAHECGPVAATVCLGACLTFADGWGAIICFICATNCNIWLQACAYECGCA
jgi:hypothetical protein